MNVRIDGRGVSRVIAHATDKMGVDKTTPGSAPTLTEGLTGTPDREVPAMENRSQSRKQIALEHLALARREFEQATDNRLYFIRLARAYGNTNAEIGDVLGIGESAVRSMLKRHGGDA